MNSFILLIIPLLITGCSSKKAKLSELASIDEKFVVKEIPVEDEKEALARINNRLNYLKLLFEQSLDPYHETPKWEAHCYEDNRPGKAERNGEIIYSVSRLYFDSRKYEGFCSDKFYASPGYSIDVYCPDKKILRQYKFLSAKKISVETLDLCR